MSNPLSLIIAFLLFVILIIVIIVYTLWKKIQLSNSTQPEHLKTFELFQQQMHHISNQLNERLKENNQSITQTNQAVGDRLDNAARAYTQVMNKLNQLEEANKRIYDVGKDLASLQDILQAPKMRGTLGEFFLGDEGVGVVSLVVDGEAVSEGECGDGDGSVVGGVCFWRDDVVFDAECGEFSDEVEDVEAESPVEFFAGVEFGAEAED